jgi:hypothetical protein
VRARLVVDSHADFDLAVRDRVFGNTAAWHVILSQCFYMLYFFYRQINTNIIRSGSLEDVYALAHREHRGLARGRVPAMILVRLSLRWLAELERRRLPGNEPGSHRVKFDLVELVQGMLLQLLDHNDPDRCYVTRRKVPWITRTMLTW